MDKHIQDRAAFDLIRYANVWEDARVLCQALEPAPGKRFLSIASGGDNAFTLLAAGADVVAADLSLAQLAIIELKRAAIRALPCEGYLAFSGIRPSDVRLETYAALQSDLPETARAFWDAHADDIAAGFIHSGKFERFFKMFRTRILPLIHSRKSVAELMREKPQAEREMYYRTRWGNLRWRMLFKIFMSRYVMGKLGRDPEFFRYVEGSVGERILKRTERALTTQSIHDNPYLDYILNGNYTQSLPAYLAPERYEALREGLDRLELFHGTIEAAARQCHAGGFDGYNLSDIFEYLDTAQGAAIYGSLLDHARPGARVVYWNMLVPRQCPEVHAHRISALGALAAACHEQDQAFFYDALVIEEVNH